MSILKKILGQDVPRMPYDVRVEYIDGSVGRVHVFAVDMREAIKLAAYWVSHHMPAVKVLISRREAMSNGKGQGRNAPGQQKETPMTRTNPETGETETQMVTNERWREEGKQLRAEGWSRPEDEATEEEPAEGGSEG